MSEDMGAAPELGHPPHEPCPRWNSPTMDAIIEHWLSNNRTTSQLPLRGQPLEQSSPLTKSTVHSLSLGTGSSIFSTLQPALEAATSEVILVTCFWAPSASLVAIRAALLHLSSKALQSPSNGKIRVRICLSSLSLWQKLTHTSSRAGQTYAAATWPTKFGLPSAEELAGLDLEIKSIFIRPFSVMHPKFIIIDRQKVFLPSCNVSWEDWFEGSVELSGGIVEHFVQFWERFWARPLDRGLMPRDADTGHDEVVGMTLPPINDASDPAQLPRYCALGLMDVPSILLESEHHANPCFRWPWQAAAPPPRTRLNTFLLSAFAIAKRSIYIQTPNLTSPPVLTAILGALKRGVQVHIVTSERLMILEQLVTAGTTTARCVRRLVKRYKTLENEATTRSKDEEARLVEAGRAAKLGRLTIEFYSPNLSIENRALTYASGYAAEPVQSHFKCTVVDDELVVLGSGNMDRASWYTSQELGVAFFSPDLAAFRHGVLRDVLRERIRLAFDSGVVSSTHS